MWPLISSFRIASACSAASSGVSANLTPPAFIRPPVSTCDLITTGPPISSAALRASSGVVQKPYLVTGIPASSTILRASYSKNLIRRGSLHAETEECAERGISPPHRTPRRDRGPRPPRRRLWRWHRRRLDQGLGNGPGEPRIEA